MKRFIEYTAIFLLSVLLCACNNNTFVQPLLDDVNEHDVKCGSPVNIRFTRSGWKIYNVSGNENLNGDIFDINGRLIKHSSKLEGEGLLKMVYSSDLLSFRIERREFDKLDIIVDENLYDENRELSVEVGDDDERKCIKLNCIPGSKYKLDSIRYDYSRCEISTTTTRAKYTVTYDNSASGSIMISGIYPYVNEKCRLIIHVDSIVPNFNRIFGIPVPTIKVPVIDNGNLCEDAISMELIPDNIQEYPLPMPDDELVEIKVNPGMIERFQLNLVYDEYKLPYKMYLSNFESGRTRIYTGEITYSCPYKYVILKLNSQK